MARKVKTPRPASRAKVAAAPRTRKRKLVPKIPPVVQHAILCAKIADDKKAEDIIILDLRAAGYVADMFVIATGRNERQRAAIASEIQRQLRELGERPLGVAGMQGSWWVLLDYVDVVVHLFSPEARRLYDLELLWGDNPRIAWS